MRKKVGAATEIAGANTRTGYADVRRGVLGAVLVPNATRIACPRVLARHKFVYRGL